MIRQAHTYLVGALSGVTLIGIAIGVFVVLVSAQVFHDWPLAEVGSQNQKAAVAPAKALPAPGQVVGATASTVHPRNAKAAGAAAATRVAKHPARRHAGPGAIADATSPATAVESAPSGNAGGHESSSGGNSGSQPSSTAPSQGSSPSAGSGGSSGSSGSSGTGTTATGSSSSSSGSSGSSGGSTGTGTSTGTGVTTPPVTAVTKPSQVVTETVNGTVNGVDENLLGGTLKESGVTETTENLVNGVAGPESVVGKVVDGAGEVVGGLLGGGH